VFLHSCRPRWRSDDDNGSKEVSPAVPLIRNRDYVIRFAGQIVSTLGTRISSIAFPLLTLSLTQSALQVGIVSALGNLPTIIVGLPAGALIDRWDRKKVAILSDAVRGVNLVSIPVALAFGQLTVWQLYATALLDGLMSVLFSPRFRPRRGASCPWSSSLRGAVRSVCCLQSGRHRSTLGGLLYGIGNAIPFLADAISYSASVVSLLFVRSEFQLERQSAAGSSEGDTGGTRLDLEARDITCSDSR
jgi:MFS family permease